MRTFEQWLKEEKGLEMPKGKVDGRWFAEQKLPMIVSCTCCGETMAIPSARIDYDGSIYCPSCVD